ncbi:MAG: transposase [Firmicutes bacterium]|nr:transposase [Bacillota bacterium]
MNVAFLWFLGSGIDRITSDHGVLSKARKRFGRGNSKLGQSDDRLTRMENVLERVLSAW